MDYLMLVFYFLLLYSIYEPVYTKYFRVRKETKDDLIERYIEAKRRKLI